MRWLAVLAALCACGSKPPPLGTAGSEKDEGHGILAQASTQFMTSEDNDRLGDTPAGYGGSSYGGATYAGYVVPAWPATPPNRVPKYSQKPDLTGSIEGTIGFRPLAASPCNAPRAALAYIEKIQVGRALLNEGSRPASVGGTLTKRGCALAPAIQIVTPLPAALTIHGDAKPGSLRVDGKVFDLQRAGRVAMQLQAGTTRVELDGGGSAWIVAIDTPYYAITDDHGRFRIDELAPGTYEVTIWQPPGTTIKRTVKVDARRPARLDIK
jgi:Carboxypeptidase regulatory-like domain